MWPMLLDYTKDESKRILRRLELEAYASIISVFRAQGDLCKEKKRILQDLQQTLSISTERHRAEVRRAINDEKLATIADNIAGTISTAEWMIEGRRLVPLMPRLVPQTAFTATANQAASAMMEKNATLPPPSQTWNKDGPTAALPKPTRSTSPNSNVVVLPSGTSIHIKGMLNQEEEDELGTNIPSRRSSNRSLSSDSQNAASVSTQTPRITYTTASSTLPGSSPVKITISKSPQGRPITVQSGSQPPKVILVTSAGPVPGSTVIQRSMSVPVVRTTPTTLSTYTGTGPPRPSVLIPGGPSSSGSQVVSSFPGMVTSSSSTSLVSTTVTIPSPSVSSSPASFNPSVQIGFGKARPRLVPRQRYPAMVPQQKPGIVIPMGPQIVSPSPNASPGSQVSQSQQSTASIQVTPANHGSAAIQMKTLSKPTIQIKQEGGMKIITQSNTSKILPKPSQISGSGGTPVVVVNTAQSSPGNTQGATLLPRSVSSYTAHSGGKVLNITTPGGRVIATTTKATNVVTVNPKTLHLTAVKSGSGSTTVSKPNVIVVQKTQHTRFQSPLGQGGTNIRTIATSSLPGSIDKELMGLVHKDSQGRNVLTASSSSITTASTGRAGERRVIITTSGGSSEVKQPVSIIHRGRVDSDGRTSSLLAELIQAAGIMPCDGVVESTAHGTDPYDFDTADGVPQMGTTTVSLAASTMVPHHHSQHQITRLPLQWQPQQDTEDSSAEEESIGYAKEADGRRTSQDNEVGTEQVLTIEQAISLFNKEGVSLQELDHPPSTQPSTSVSLPPSISQLLGQAKVSILSTSKTFIGDNNREPTVTIQAAESALGGVLVSPEEGLKEGQLDTQTGLFCQVKAVDKYSSIRKHVQPPTTQNLPVCLPPLVMSSVLIQSEPERSSSSSSLSLTHPPIDLLSSSLAEAQINLDSFNDDGDDDDDDGEDYDEEDEDIEDESAQGMDIPATIVNQTIEEPVVTSRPGMAEVLREETAKDGTRILTVSNPASSQQEPTVAHNIVLVSLPSQLSRPSSLLPSISTSASSSPAPAYVTIQELPCTALSKAPNTTTLNVVSQGPTISQKSGIQTNVLPIAVSVEPSPSVITLKLDDLTSRAGKEEDQLHKGASKDTPAISATKLKESDTADLLQQETVVHADDAGTGGSDIDSQSDGIVSSDQSCIVRSSKRKRKHPSDLDEPLQAAPGSWVKVAASLLLKVARFKGSPRDKNEIPAAEWFTFPVDPLDAPDYYTVIQSPMDFSTMRKKLETGQYGSFEDFQLDMDLIRTNCYIYNSEGTKVRQDCDEVMIFYKSELAKLQEKHLNKAFMQNVSSPKRAKIEDKIQQ